MNRIIANRLVPLVIEQKFGGKESRLSGRDLRRPVQLGQIRPLCADLLDQQAQEQADVGYDADAFDGASVGQFGDNGRVDVDAHELYARRSHVADTDAMEHGTEHQNHIRACDQPCIVALGLDHIRKNVGQRAVVSDGGDQRKGNSGSDAFVKNSAPEHSLLDRCPDAPAASDGIDGAEMVAVPATDGGAPVHIHAERGAQERLLDVVDGDAVPAKQYLYEAGAYEFGQMFSAAGMDDYRTGYDGDLAAALADAFKFPGDLVDDKFDFPLAADPGTHKSELRHGRAADSAFLPGLALAYGLNSVHPDDHAITAPEVTQQSDDGDGAHRVMVVNHNAAVHALALDAHPLASDPHFGRIDGRDVKIFGRDAIDRDGFESRVGGALRGGGDAAKFDELANEVVEHIGRGCRNADFRPRNALALFAELKVQNLKAASAIDSQFQGAVEKARVQEVTFQTENPAYDIAVGSRAWPWQFVQAQGKTFGCAAGFDKLSQRRFKDLEARGRKPGSERFAGAMEDESVADIDGVSGEMNGVSFVEDKALFFGHPALDLGVGAGVESRRVIQQKASFEWAETGVEMVEAFIDESQADDLNAKQLGQERVSVELGAEAVARPENGLRAVEQARRRHLRRVNPWAVRARGSRFAETRSGSAALRPGARGARSG